MNYMPTQLVLCCSAERSLALGGNDSSKQPRKLSPSKYAYQLFNRQEQSTAAAM